MSRDLDELFGSEGGEPRPRSGLVHALLGVGLSTTLLGMLCSAAPGGLIVLVAWAVVEKEADRVESGYLPADARAEVARLQQLTLASILMVLLLFVLQGWLFCAGYYEVLWESALTRLASWVNAVPLPADAP